MLLAREDAASQLAAQMLFIVVFLMENCMFKRVVLWAALFAVIITANFTPRVTSADDAVLSADQIVQALRPRHTRGLILTPADTAASKEIRDLQRQAKDGPLSLAERDKLADATKNNSSVDITVYFEFGSSAISQKSVAQLAALAVALRSDALKNETFLIAGHTDAVGSSDYNQHLSEDRANSVKSYLVENFSVDSRPLTAVGYGKEHLLTSMPPDDARNRRVQIVTLNHQSAGE